MGTPAALEVLNAKMRSLSVEGESLRKGFHDNWDGWLWATLWVVSWGHGPVELFMKSPDELRVRRWCGVYRCRPAFFVYSWGIAKRRKPRTQGKIFPSIR